MVDKIEMSLDDIIKTNKIGFRRGRASFNGKKPAGKPQRNNGNNKQQQKGGVTKFRGTANRQIGKPKGRTAFRTAAAPRKFTRVRVDER